MRKDLGKLPAVFPMPVLMVAAYDEKGVVGVLNAAWGTICGPEKIALCIDEDHKTTKNIRATRAFTVALADRDHMDRADFFGIATGNKMPDKFARSGFHAEKSAHVNAPVIMEFPVTMECELAEIVETAPWGALVCTSRTWRVPPVVSHLAKLPYIHGQKHARRREGTRRARLKTHWRNSPIWVMTRSFTASEVHFKKLSRQHRARR